MDKDKDSTGQLPEGEIPAPAKRSIGRRIWRWFRNTLFVFIGLIIALAIVIQLPFFQTWLAHKATAWLKQKFGVELSIEKVKINFFRGSVDLKNVYAGDDHGDTLIRAGILQVKLQDIRLKESKLELASLVLEGGYLNMRRYKGDPKPNLSLFIDKFKKGQQQKKKKGGKPFVIVCRSLILDECNVRIRNDEAAVRDADFLPNDIRIESINGKVSDFSVIGDSLLFKVNNLSATEGSGMVLRSLSSDVLICSKEMAFKNFKLKTPRSELSGYYSMRYRNWGAFSNFIDSVTLVADLDLSNIDMKDLAYFSGGLRGIDASFRFKGGVKGTLSNLKGRDIALYFGSVTQLVGKMEMTGLPDINNTFIYFNLNKLVTNYYDLQMIPLPPFSEQKKLKVPVEISRMGMLKFSGNFTGFIKDFTAFGKLETSIGSASMDLNLAQGDDKVIRYKGDLDLNNFDVGKLINQQKLLGKVSLKGRVEGQNFDKKTANVNFTGNISSFDVNNYTYHDVQTTAYFKDQTFGGLVNIDDPNINLLFNGTINLADARQPEFSFYSKISNADLSRLHILKTDSSVRFQTEMKMNFKGLNVDEVVGNIRFFDTEYKQNGICYDLDSLIISSVLNPDSTKSIRIGSPFVDADFNGRFKFIPLMNEMKKRINMVLPSIALTVNDKIKPIDQNFDFNVHLKNTSQVTNLLMPKLEVAFNSIVYGNYDSRRNDLNLNLKSSSVSYGGFKLNGITVFADNQDDFVTVSTVIDNFSIIDSVKMDNIRFDLGVEQDSVEIVLGFKNKTERLNSGFLHARTYMGAPPHYDLRLIDSYFYYEDTLLRINNDNSLVLDDGLLAFNNIQLFRAYDKKSILVLNGKSEKGSEEALSIDFAEFPIEILNFFLKKSKVEIDGMANGNLKLFRLLDSPYFTSSLTVNDFGFNRIPMGDLTIRSSYETADKMLLLNTDLTIDGSKVLVVKNGRFYPFAKKNQFDINADINRLNLAAFEQFANPIFSGLKGSVSGNFALHGSTSAPDIYSSLHLDDAGMRLVYLNASFDLYMEPARNIIINNHGILIPPIRLRDRYAGMGYLEGTINHDMFKDIEMNIDISTHNLCMMETDARQNEQFYGKAFASGFAKIHGPIKNLVVDADMRTEKNTVLNIPLGGHSSVSENSFVTFVNKVMDSTNIARPVMVKPPENNFTVNLSVVVTQDATARIIFDETVGDVLTASGESDEIRLELDTKGKFNLFGNYEIKKGNYLFTLQNIISKPFTIKSGSSISFNGNPYYASINATAIYQANASLYPIIYPFDPTLAEMNRRSTKVNCELTLTNTLANMLIGFNLEVPQADESTKSIVRATINTEEEMNRQVFALLVLNQFLPPEAIGGGASSNLISGGLGTSSVEFLSSQMNNWLSKLTKDVNLNVKYKAGDNTITDQVSVALSTQLFNDRIIIDGDLGVGGQRVNTDNKQNQIVGNVLVEVKLNDKGNLRLKAFNRSNDNNLLKNSAPYTQGIGFSYRVEFDSWNDLIRKKNKKEAVADSLKN